MSNIIVAIRIVPPGAVITVYGGGAATTTASWKYVCVDWHPGDNKVTMVELETVILAVR
jgi:hypothetical protein